MFNIAVYSPLGHLQERLERILNERNPRNLVKQRSQQSVAHVAAVSENLVRGIRGFATHLIPLH